MEKCEAILLIFVCSILLNCREYDEYQKINDELNVIEFEYHQVNQSELKDSLLSQEYIIELNEFNNGPFIKNHKKNVSIEFDEIIRISDIMSDTLLITSGVRSIESGLKYFFDPYSEIYLIKKSDLTILRKFTIDEIVTNARVKNSTLYFWYGSSNNYRLGKINF